MTPVATVSLVIYLLRERQELGIGSKSAATAAATQAAIDRISRMQPANHGEQAGNQHDAEQDEIEQVIGIGSAAPSVSKLRALRFERSGRIRPESMEPESGLA